MQTKVLLSLALLFFSYYAVDGAVKRKPSQKCKIKNGLKGTVYEYTTKDLSGEKEINLADFAGKQEPGKNFSEIMNGIKHVRPGNGFVPKFPLTAKTDVNGEKEHRLFTFLKKNCPSTRDGFANKHDLFYAPFKNDDVRWNFEKFLVDDKGKPYMRYDPSTEPLTGIMKDIEAIIKNEI